LFPFVSFLGLKSQKQDFPALSSKIFAVRGGINLALTLFTHGGTYDGKPLFSKTQ
jgi:hypothetical protein